MYSFSGKGIHYELAFESFWLRPKMEVSVFCAQSWKDKLFLINVNDMLMTFCFYHQRPKNSVTHQIISAKSHKWIMFWEFVVSSFSLATTSAWNKLTFFFTLFLSRSLLLTHIFFIEHFMLVNADSTRCNMCLVGLGHDLCSNWSHELELKLQHQIIIGS